MPEQPRWPTSFGSTTRAVKRRRASTKAGRLARLSKHVEGWPLVPVSVLPVVIVMALVLPRPVQPERPPVPQVDRKLHARFQRLEATRASRAQVERLSFEVREVGERLRRFGAAQGRGDAERAAAQLAELRRAAARARQLQGDEPLLSLRAIQTELFVHAVRAWDGDKPTRELLELGGEFTSRVQANRWWMHGQVSFNPAELGALFRVRWGRLTGLGSEHPFYPVPTDWRILLRFMLLHPELGERTATQAQLAYIAELERRAPEYPAQLARGVILYNMGAVDQAADAFRRHLALNPDGRYQLRARNYLRASLQGAAAVRRPDP